MTNQTNANKTSGAAKHTAGPWVVSLAQDTAHEKGRTKIYQKGTPNIIAEFSFVHPDNARLIASAPEMYSLLRSYVTTYPIDDLHDKASNLIHKIIGDKDAVVKVERL